MIAIQSPLAPHSRLLSRPGVALILMLASACTTVDTGESLEAPIVPRHLEAWEARGKVAVTLGTETETVRFIWQRFDEETETITLSGPLSMNRQIITRRGKAFYQADGSALRPAALSGENPALSAALNRLPPESLGTWLLGHEPTDGNWTVKVDEWQFTPPWRTPARVTIHGSGIDIRVMISQWGFNPLP